MNYQRLAFIDKGGMAEVYRGRHNEFGTEVALKYLFPEYCDDEEIVERFLREAKICHGLTHPNIVKVTDLGRDEGRPFIVMELLHGQTLTGILQGKTLSEAETIGIARQILDALSYAHDAGVVHRDVKPSNIFVCRDGRVKVMDFGIARVAGFIALTRHGAQLGTSEYMSPEQVGGNSELIRPSTDLYSVGIVLFQMLSGLVPFSHANSQEVMKMHLHSPVPEIPGQVSDGMRAIVRRALGKSADDRFRNAAEMHEALMQLRIPQDRIKPVDNGTKSKPDWPIWVGVGAAVVGLILLLSSLSANRPATMLPTPAPIIATATPMPVEAPAATENTATPESISSETPIIVVDSPTVRPTVAPTVRQTAVPTALPISTRRETKMQSVPFGTTHQARSDKPRGWSNTIRSGIKGQRQVVYEITTRGGKELSRNVVSQTLINAPKNRVVEYGTAPPSHPGPHPTRKRPAPTVPRPPI